MPLIEIITDLKSEEELKKVIDKKIVNNGEVMYIKEKNIDNIKNIKLETVVLNSEVTNNEQMKKIVDNSKYLILNADYNSPERFKINRENIITYGYKADSDITISSVKENESFLSLQRTITSIYNKKIEMQEIKADISYEINVYNIMIIVALTMLYVK